MYYPNFKTITLEKPNKVLFSVYASAVLMHLLSKQRDAVGLSTYSDEIENHIVAKTSTRHHQLLYHELLIHTYFYLHSLEEEMGEYLKFFL